MTFCVNRLLGRWFTQNVNLFFYEKKKKLECHVIQILLSAWGVKALTTASTESKQEQLIYNVLFLFFVVVVFFFLKKTSLFDITLSINQILLYIDIPSYLNLYVFIMCA